MYVFSQQGDVILDLNRVESFRLDEYHRRSAPNEIHYDVHSVTVSGKDYLMGEFAYKRDAEIALFWLVEAWKRRTDDRTVNLGEDYTATDDPDSLENALLRHADKYII